jgi:hypothetical protein
MVQQPYFFHIIKASVTCTCALIYSYEHLSLTEVLRIFFTIILQLVVRRTTRLVKEIEIILSIQLF